MILIWLFFVCMRANFLVKNTQKIYMKQEKIKPNEEDYENEAGATAVRCTCTGTEIKPFNEDEQDLPVHTVVFFIPQAHKNFILKKCRYLPYIYDLHKCWHF